MSRRPAATAAADRSEANRATLKALVKVEANKSCADCKRNKHPRWASWNLGVFVCIRCSGIHRGMGTHVSRVKSVDLDSWTDEQLQSMLRWGNARANRYWEHKLAAGHVPNEAKIENFIRTKYDSRRWVMDGPMPDPSTLDEGPADDDDVPLNVVQEKVKQQQQQQQLQDTGSRNGSVSAATRAAAPPLDLFADEPPPVRPSTTGPAALPTPASSRAPVAQPKQTRPGESLLGLDFFGGSQSAAPARPASTGPNTPGLPGRSDLKQSILSLYASKPAVPQQPKPATDSFGGMALNQQRQPLSPSAALDDAFGSLSFTSSPPPQTQQQKQQQPALFSTFSPPTGHARQASSSASSLQIRSPPPLSGGGFFDAKPVPPKPTSPPAPVTSRPAPVPKRDSFGDFSSASPIASPPVVVAAAAAAAAAPPPKPVPQQPPQINYSAFNLSSSRPAPTAAPTQAAPPSSSVAGLSAISSADAWGSNEAWATPDPAPAPVPAPAAATPARSQQQQQKQQQQTSSRNTAFDASAGWGEPEPTHLSSTTSGGGAAGGGGGGFRVQQDEDFGGWAHASPIGTESAGTGGRQAGSASGGGGADDLFGNVWG